MDKNIFSGIAFLPRGNASETITKGCIVLEGGAFRGVYGEGVLDALMENDINMATTIGCSAGAMNGMNYVAGQIGRAARVNLQYRHDSRYVGIDAFRHNQGVIGFDFVFNTLEGSDPFNMKRFNQPDRRFIVVASNCRTGRAEYFEKGHCSDIIKATQASASMPFVSKMVELDGDPYLDGGCCDKIPYQWALDQHFDKSVVVRTREASYRKPLHSDRSKRAMHFAYRNYPEFAKCIVNMNEAYNHQCDEIVRLEKENKFFVISPSKQVKISRLEKDMEKLGALYYEGYNDAKKQLPALLSYLYD